MTTAPVDAGVTVPPTELAADLLVALRTGDDTEPLLSALADCSETSLAPVREDHDTGLAFWLNCYNAGTKLLLTDRPELYESRWRFFRAPALSVAGHPLGLDDVEHGVLRGSRSKYGLGYLPRLLPDSFEHRYRLDHVDPRLHFALHCGAASCPAIRAYEPDAVDAQLDTATRTYLDATVEYDPDAGVLRVPRMFRWFPGDFGGRSGVREFLRRYDQLPDETADIGYLDWDWSRETPTFA
ncbi:DUF547 domain-containing protein [Haloarcula onubensis]|uniref:DUF547 domain-containing protein n=1 Tax=Haloarcula onubensis TaxID=2950539 RepID=A0ABU2FJW8_9EURY|nr:DUF547 domain-containing protein [Halomicroarcula sp. S3CR25-11]MDS0281056.1 DUF547 domain-containing protein [Halomicroarcula sp. S3CR25-11]